MGTFFVIRLGYTYVYMQTISFRYQIAVLMSLLFLITPFLIHAQTTDQSELRAVIRAAILKDSRSASLPPAQIETMVDALTARAQTQGVTPAAIAFRAGSVDDTVVLPSHTTTQQTVVCADISSPLCALGYAVGFNNPDKSVPIGLWITSGILTIVIWRMQKMRLEGHL